ncbi:MAG: hypothetical protein J5903_03885 [Clostridia bacterium]|nr:hypothetical protein [Clostridia bacterium]
MNEINITENNFSEENVLYLYDSLSGIVGETGGGAFVETDDARTRLKLVFPEKYDDLIRCEAEDKIADVIAVKYKYEFFGKKLKTEGLSPLEKEILFSALIAADLTDDKRYIIRKLRSFAEYTIDGTYNFRLAPLRRKWEDVVGYIPSYFPPCRLTDFVSYLVGEKSGSKVTVENGKVYDKHYNLLNRTALTGKTDDGRIIREVILSECGDLRLLTPVSEKDDEYLKKYFAGRISFS